MPDEDKKLIEGTLEYLKQEGVTGYDCWLVKIGGKFIGYVYILSASHLLPENINFKDELVVHTVY